MLRRAQRVSDESPRRRPCLVVDRVAGDDRTRVAVARAHDRERPNAARLIEERDVHSEVTTVRRRREDARLRHPARRRGRRPLRARIGGELRDRRQLALLAPAPHFDALRVTRAIADAPRAVAEHQNAGLRPVRLTPRDGRLRRAAGRLDEQDREVARENDGIAVGRWECDERDLRTVRRPRRQATDG